MAKKDGQGSTKLYGEKVYFDRLDKEKFNLVHKNSEMKNLHVYS